MNIYVSNLSYNITDEDLKALFVAYGEVSSAKVITDRMTDQSRGFGFVEMPDDEAARKALAELEGAMVGNRAIKVIEARPKEGEPGGPRKKSRFQKGFNKNNW